VKSQREDSKTAIKLSEALCQGCTLPAQRNHLRKYSSFIRKKGERTSRTIREKGASRKITVHLISASPQFNIAKGKPGESLKGCEGNGVRGKEHTSGSFGSFSKPRRLTHLRLEESCVLSQEKRGENRDRERGGGNLASGGGGRSRTKGNPEK